MLPKLDTPTYELTLPLSGKKIKFRPFLVKEQKNLLMAMESEDAPTIHNAVRDILENCTLSKGFDIDSLPIIDVEYYFINLRAKSVGEVVESRYKCNNEVDGKKCNHVMDVDINLMDIKPVQEVEVSPEIQLTDKITIKMRYPDFSVVKDSVKYDNLTEVSFNMIANSIEYIYDGEQFFYSKETPREELIAFVEGMNSTQFEKVENFFNNMPKLKKKVDLKCSKCGFDHVIEVEGLESFFV